MDNTSHIPYDEICQCRSWYRRAPPTHQCVPTTAQPRLSAGQWQLGHPSAQAQALLGTLFIRLLGFAAGRHACNGMLRYYDNSIGIVTMCSGRLILFFFLLFFLFIIPYFEILVKSFSSKYTLITSHNYVRYMIDSFRT